MNLVLLLLLLRFGFGSSLPSFISEEYGYPWQLSVYPRSQVVNEYNDIIIDCHDRNDRRVFWKPLPAGARQDRGRLIINNIKRIHEGVYICSTEDGEIEERAMVKVVPRAKKFRTSTVVWKDQFQTTRDPFTLVSSVSSTPYPCLYGFCNGTCCKSDSIDAIFDCANGQKINKSLVCNRENDCDDGSDESGCAPWSPKLTVLPKHKMEVYCGDEDRRKSGTLILECASVGHPIPRIRWKKYEGHVPMKCQQYSRRGHGILTCPNFEQSDQGAYSCVAENSVNSAESQPKTIAKCSNRIRCNGFRVVNEDKIEHCLECYCSGRTTQCQNLKSNLTVIKIPFPESHTEIFANEEGKVLFIPTTTNFTPTETIRQSSQEIVYCSLNENDLEDTSLIKSFGRSIIIPRYKGKTAFVPKAPSLIIRGNGISLTYTANLISPPKDSVMGVSVRFWPGNWHHLNKTAATRADLMKVLSNVDTLLIRCEYEAGNPVKWDKNATIAVESSVITDFAVSVSYVEKCHCPAGYAGLSCETCAEGYKKKAAGGDFVCEKIYVPPTPCKVGYIGVNCSSCDTFKGYQRRGDICVKPSCHPDGSTSTFLDNFGKCSCREGVTGNYCDTCQTGYFHLHKSKGCDKCWCSGVTNQCASSKYYRTVISNIPRGGYNYSDGRNFWLLPSDFSGNRLTSYGGFLNYTMKFKPHIPKEKTYLTVELLSMEDVTLSYTHKTMDTSLTKIEKSWSVPLIEDNWRKSNLSVTRGEFLAVLSKVKAIYIESPYHLSSGQVTLTSTLMSSASPNIDDGNELALEVEQCTCPKGYTGLSCETCSDGYYKKRNGTMSMCVKCNCSYCDPDLGCPVCPQLMYRDNPEEEKIPVCKPCPCKENGVSCVKDDYNQIFCKCKPGFSGMHCEHQIPEEKDELTLTISPRRIRGKKVGTVIVLNCTVLTTEEMILSAKKNYGSAPPVLLNKDSGTSTNKISQTFEVPLEAELKSIECFVHDSKGNLAGHVVATVEDPIIIVKPVAITNCDSDIVQVKESGNQDLTCEATGSPTPMVNWYRINGSKTEKVDTSDGVHSIERASLSDNGTVYTCIAENSRGDKATCSKVLIVRKKCEVVKIIPNTVKTEEGKTVTLECKTTANSSVKWSKLNSFGMESTFFSIRTTVLGGILRITNATASDSGNYICSAIGQSGKINNTALVTITEKKEPPTVYIQEYDKKLYVGEDFEAHCKVTGKPTPRVFWKKVNGTLDNNINSYGETLTIRKARIENSGIYACEAVSSVGNASSYISIDVGLKALSPKVNISDKLIERYEGDEVNISCLAIGYPRPNINIIAPNITFTRNVRVNDDILLLEPFESEKIELSFKISKKMDGMRIICAAENEAGRDEIASTIKVYQRKVLINETVEFVPIGSYFEIICNSDGGENITWEKQGGVNGDECPIPNGLMITSVQRQHNGTYICKADSITKKIINLNVVGFVPKFSRARQSYLVLPARLNSISGIRVEMTFKPTSENGFLLRKSDHQFDIFLEDRKIHIGRGKPFLNVALNNAIELGKWYTLVATFDRNYMDITVYNESMSIYERKTERTSDFNININGKDHFFVGGSKPKDKLPFIRGNPNFDGCISRLIIDQHEFDIIKESSYSFNVTLCSRCSEDPDPCHDKGKCLDAPTQYGFICVCPNDRKNRVKCPKSCVGRGCETMLDLCGLLKPCKGYQLHTCENRMYHLQCSCPYGYSGITCDQVQEYAFCSNGNGYVKLHPKFLERSPGVPEVIRMSFTLHNPNGQLLWQGNKANHLSISVHHGTLKYVYLNQHSKLELHGAKLDINKKYSISARRINGSVTLEIKSAADNKIYRNSTSKYHTNRVFGDIYLGIVPNNTLHVGHHVGLTGCIHYVSFGDKEKVNLPVEALERVNISQPSKLENDSSDSTESEESKNKSGEENNEVDYK